MSSNIEQSVKDRLKNIANESGKDFNFISIQYMQERFLARLEQSKYRDNLILKGALLLIAYNVPTVRPSKDIDFKGEHTSNDIDQIREGLQKLEWMMELRSILTEWRSGQSRKMPSMVDLE